MSGQDPPPSRSDAAPRWPQATELAARLRALSGETIRGMLLYGSHLLRTSPDRYSAVDMVVIVDDYRDYYRALAREGELHRPVFLMTALAKVLAPNVLAFAPDDGQGGIIKYQLISKADFERGLGPDPPDHFLLARMVQRVGVLYAQTDADEAWLGEELSAARGRVLSWMAPYLTEPVDAEGLGRRLLEVCYAGELRPESAARSEKVFEAQADHFREVFTPVLEKAAADGVVRRDGERYSLVAPVSRRVSRRWRAHFRASKVRTTARWFKHIVTFVNWLPYIQRKVERHSGRTIELTTIERKLPLIFLWPRVAYVFMTRPRTEVKRREVEG